MHELSVCQGLLRQLVPWVEQHQGPLIQVRVRIGPLAGVEPGLLQAAFAIARQGTVAAQAELLIEHSPLRVRCNECEIESKVTANDLRCRHCGYQQTQLISGDELLLVSIQFSKESQHV